jgi:hypothetical protein
LNERDDVRAPKLDGVDILDEVDRLDEVDVK